MELAITQPFFELDNQDFAWKFVWTIQKNGHPNLEQNADLQKNVKSTKSTKNLTQSLDAAIALVNCSVKFQM